MHFDYVLFIDFNYKLMEGEGHTTRLLLWPLYLPICIPSTISNMNPR